MKKSENQKLHLVYQLKITLIGTKPPVWRRFLISSKIKFSELHLIIQEVMGWHNCHLYNFNTGSCVIESRRGPFGCSLDEFYADYEAEKTNVNDWLDAVNDQMIYEYDFGDGWEHKVVVEKIFEANEITAPLPTCIAGKLKCPPEDCGGVWGFSELKSILLENDHPDHESKLEWLGGEVPDWEYFSVEQVNQCLEYLRLNDIKRLVNAK